MGVCFDSDFLSETDDGVVAENVCTLNFGQYENCSSGWTLNSLGGIDKVRFINSCLSRSNIGGEVPVAFLIPYED